MRHDVRMSNSSDLVRPSRITVPEHAHPLVRLLFQLMRDQGVRYNDLEWRSGVLQQTFKSWRCEKTPSLTAIEATLGAVGYRLLPCPPLDDLPEHLRDQLEECGQHFLSDDEALAAAVYLATSKPQRSDTPQPAWYRPSSVRVVAAA